MVEWGQLQPLMGSDIIYGAGGGCIMLMGLGVSGLGNTWGKRGLAEGLLGYFAQALGSL